jgi:hypothetical protein
MLQWGYGYNIEVSYEARMIGLIDYHYSHVHGFVDVYIRSAFWSQCAWVL